MRIAKKEKIIAKNPLSKNIARKLGYYDQNIGPKGFKAILEKTAIEISKQFPEQKITWQAIESWIYASDNDETKPKRQPQFDSLAVFAKVIGINNFWELYIPEGYKTEQPSVLGLSKIKQKIFDTIIKADDEDLIGVISYLSSYFDENIKYEYKKEKKILYKTLLNLLTQN